MMRTWLKLGSSKIGLSHSWVIERLMVRVRTFIWYQLILKTLYGSANSGIRINFVRPILILTVKIPLIPGSIHFFLQFPSCLLILLLLHSSSYSCYCFRIHFSFHLLGYSLWLILNSRLTYRLFLVLSILSRGLRYILVGRWLRVRRRVERVTYLLLILCFYSFGLVASLVLLHLFTDLLLFLFLKPP